MIIDPWGKIVAVLPDGPGFVISEIDLDYLSRVRCELPCLAHRRLN
jgi:predicted amidohydrolase